MGFMAWLAVALVLFLAADVTAIAKGEKVLAASLTAVIAMGIACLWLLWTTAPM